MRQALASHWPEYLMEAAELGIFMISACLFTALLEYPASPVRQAIAEPLVCHTLIGLAMGLTAIGIIYSPWGKQSGAHFNPAVTLTFWRLGKVASWDSVFYIVAQFAGGVAGVELSALVLGAVIEDTTVNYAVTVPGAEGRSVAFLAEFVISFGIMTVILGASNRPSLARLTGVFAGVLVAVYIIVEGPLSGMSMNPARTFGSALPAQVWTGFWIYCTAPVLAMLAAARVYQRAKRPRKVFCAKLHHNNDKRCIFCEYHGGAGGDACDVASQPDVTQTLNKTIHLQRT